MGSQGSLTLLSAELAPLLLPAPFGFPSTRFLALKPPSNPIYRSSMVRYALLLNKVKYVIESSRWIWMDFGSESRYDEKCDDRLLRMRCTGDWSASCSFTVTT